MYIFYIFLSIFIKKQFKRPAEKRTTVYFVYLFLSIGLSFCLYVYISVFCLYVYLSVYLFIFLSTFEYL